MGISYPIRNREFKKKKQENSKNYKTPIWPLFRPKQVGKGWESVKRKIIVSIIPYPTPNREFQKKIAKKLKILNSTVMAYFPANPG